ncbi:MAG: TIGR04149 family rSAM-modified RiPP [Firmicutes bacterium]|nr:TIGR04149 family rSAM-modified RiPP [Bacillota bacterium]
MKSLKLNKLAENRLNEKEMRRLIGGAWYYNLTYCYSRQCEAVCSAVCSCWWHPPLLDPSGGNGDDSACSTAKHLI